MLLAVAVMSALAVALLDDIRLAILRTGNAEATSQAHWYALGAEDYARVLLARAAKVPGAQTEAERTLTLPIEGGVIQARIRDATNCFNLNSLIPANGETAGDSDEEGEDAPDHIVARRRFALLLRTLTQLDADRDALADALVDWLDTDDTPEPRGAEDSHYARLDPPSRAANGPLSDIAELRAVRGFTPEVMAVLAPLVCARPDGRSVLLNVNTLHPDDAPLLVMLVGDGLTLENARRAIADRPQGGYPRAAAFWGHPALSRLTVPQGVRDLAGVRSTHFRLDIRIAAGRGRASLTSHLALPPGGDPIVLSRQFGDLS